MLGLFLVFPVLIGPGILTAPFTIAYGWWPSSARLFMALHLNSGAVVGFALAVIVLVAGSHAFLRWLYARLCKREESALPINWPWKWTFCGFGVLFFTLQAIGSLMLATHQLYWLSKSTDPLFTDPIREKFGIFRAALMLQKAAEAAEWDGLKTREAFWKGNFEVQGQPASEAIQPVWIEQDKRGLRAIILVPRRPMHRETAGLIVILRGTNLQTRRLDDLPQVLASFGIGDVANKSRVQPALLP